MHQNSINLQENESIEKSLNVLKIENNVKDVAAVEVPPSNSQQPREESKSHYERPRSSNNFNRNGFVKNDEKKLPNNLAEVSFG